jgi:branched-subunit amino acid transport protein
VSWVLLFGAIAAATLLLRASFILSGGSGAFFERLARYVPIAALTALVVPAVLPQDGEPIYARGVAAGLAFAVAYRVKNVLVTVIVGMAALLVLLAL